MGYVQYISFAFTCLDDGPLVSSGGSQRNLSKMSMTWMEGNAMHAETLLSSWDPELCH